jgi:hypothetical protein
LQDYQQENKTRVKQFQQTLPSPCLTSHYEDKNNYRVPSVEKNNELNIHRFTLVYSAQILIFAKEGFPNHIQTSVGEAKERCD